MKSLQNKDICPYYETKCADVGCVCVKYTAWELVNKEGEVEKELNEMGIDYNEDKLSVMLSMQKIFAQKFHPIENIPKSEIDRWIRDYDLCIVDEISEALEHISYFGKKESSKIELQKEFIDIFHFLMDQLLVSGIQTKDQFISQYEKKNSIKLEAKDKLEEIFSIEKEKIEDSYEGNLQLLIYINKLLLSLKEIRQQISWKHWKKPSDTINFEQLHFALVHSFSSLVQCFILVELNASSLYSIYVTKNIENRFRQKLGY